jgi:hypothetical protein
MEQQSPYSVKAKSYRVVEVCLNGSFGKTAIFQMLLERFALDAQESVGAVRSENLVHFVVLYNGNVLFPVFGWEEIL